MRDLAFFYMISEHPVITTVIAVVMLVVVILINVSGEDKEDK